MDDLDLSIVIPAYRESKKIPEDIRAAHTFLRAQKLRGEVIVVDDGSADDTAATARSFVSEFPSLRVLAYEPNRGKGHALRFGILRAEGRNVMFADAGLCVPYEIAHIGLTMLDLHMCDIAHGSRRMRGSVKRAQPLYRRMGSQVFGVAVHALMGIPLYISDTQCGFKIYRREAARQLYGEMFTDGFMFDTEIILRALKAGYRILEFPVLWSNDSDTRYDPVRGTLRNIAELAKIRVGLARGTKPSALEAERPVVGTADGSAVRATENSPA
jgi:dolichyl-phosphate beta-glucosyltransferase